VLEGSGGVQTSELDRWSNSGMDVVSSGALTMDSSPIDMTMLMEADR
jgi:nicotinate-nucleotide pyrophosphorylase